MKIKLKKFLLDTLIVKNNIKSDKFHGNKLLAVTYEDEIIQFQTPTVFLQKIKSNLEKNFIYLRFLDTPACVFFIEKVRQLENHLKVESKADSINSLLDEEHNTIKLKMTKNTKLFENVYQIPLSTLTTECNVICLVQLSSLWITTENTAHYNLEVLEILKT